VRACDLCVAPCRVGVDTWVTEWRCACWQGVLLRPTDGLSSRGVKHGATVEILEYVRGQVVAVVVLVVGGRKRCCRSLTRAVVPSDGGGRG